jgi:CO dehydrogenase maturation factor
MILGFLGKGGSGKSTLATLMTKHLLETGNKVLAIDADHNMDLSYNLGVQENVPYCGTSTSQIKTYLGISPSESVRQVFLLGPENRFHIFPNDKFTEEYAVKKMNNLQVMVAGPHTEEIWEGDKCSHSLFTSLKVYLPYMDLKENEYVTVDEKAGMDPVGTMVPAGFDVAIISVEPTRHSTKTANQISQGLQKYGTPYIFVGNKITTEEEKQFLRNNLWTEPVAYFDFDKSKTTPFESLLSQNEIANLENIVTRANELKSAGKSREIRATNFWSKNSV